MNVGDRVRHIESGKLGKVIGIGFLGQTTLGDQQTVSVKFDDGTFSASNSYASEYEQCPPEKQLIR